MKVKIKDKEIELRKTMRSYVMYENITEGMFAPKTLTDIVTYFYCVVVSSDKNLELKFDEFLDWIDENDGVFDEFNKWLADINENSLSKKKQTKTRKANQSASKS